MHWLYPVLRTKKLTEKLTEINEGRNGLKIIAGKRKTPKPLQYKNFGVGAGDRTRTGTLSPAVDFESTTSTIPSHRPI